MKQIKKPPTQKNNNLAKSLVLIVIAILASCILLVICLLGIFRTLAAIREVYTPVEKAPIQGRFITIPDGRIFIEENGPVYGPAVVFIHGFGAWSETWRDTTSFLAQHGYHTIALDIPPFGFSTRPADLSYTRTAQAKRILAVLDVLHIQKATLVGHSYGGGATMESVFANQSRIQSLVLVDVALGLPISTANNQPNLISYLFAIRPLRNALIATTITNPFYSRSLLSSFVKDGTKLTDNRVSIYQQPLVLKDSTNDVGDWLTHDLLAPPHDSLSIHEENYRNLAIPTLLIWGKDDKVTPLAQGEYIHSLIPHSQLEVLDDTGHIPHIEHVSLFNQTLLHFLDTQTKLKQ